MDPLGTRLNEDPRLELRTLVRDAAALRPREHVASVRTWASIRARASASRGRALLLQAVAAVAVGFVCAFAAVYGRDVQRVLVGERLELAGIGTIELSPEAAFYDPPEAAQPAGEHRVFVDEGRLKARVTHQPAGRPLVVVTPHVRVIVVGTRFTVAVGGGLTSVAVEEGRVRVEMAGRAGVPVSAGESVRSDDPRLGMATPARPAEPAPPPPLPPAAPAPEPLPAAVPEDGPAAPAPAHADACAGEGSVARRRDCYVRLVGQSGLPAENATYALGRLERDEKNHEKAIEYWSMYARRFPSGALAPEVSQNLLGEYMALERYDEALAEARSFLRRFRADTRREKTQLTEAALLCTLGQSNDALARLEVLLATGSEPSRAEALFAKGRCLLAAGRRAEGVRALDRYLSAFPAGGQVEEARKILADLRNEGTQRGP